MINRDEVRTPMQWDITKNAGFSSAERTWLPVNTNYHEINVQAENKKANSILNMIRRLHAIRHAERALQEGSLELMDNLPKNVLGYRRILGDESLSILLNFDDEEKEFPIEAKESIFQLSKAGEWNDNIIRLDAYGGVILKVSS
jgi:glycosidase